MADFDPDAYLAAPAAAPAATGAFDPDAYLRSAPTTSAVAAGALGAVKGATAGWADELAGAAAAYGGLSEPIDPESGQEVPSYGAAAQNYRGVRDAYRAREAAAQAEHPYAFGAGELGGAAATMLAAPGSAAATLPARMVQGAKVGAAYGAASGAGESKGDALDTMLGAGAGAVAGGVGGAGGTLIGSGLERVAKVAYDYLGRPVVSLARGLISPEEEGMRRGAGALIRDYPQIAKGNAAGLTPTEFVAARAAGEPVMLADMGAETTRGLLRSAANTSPEGRNLINTAVQDRFENQSERVASDLRGLVSGGADAFKTRGQLIDDYNAARVPAYRKAFAQPAAQSIWNGEFEQIAQAPVVQEAIRGAMVGARNEAAKMGLTPPRNPFAVDANGRFVLGRNADGSQLTPNLQFWDVVKKNLDAIGSRESRFWAAQLRGKLDEAVPDYAAARGIAAKFFGGDNALEAGQNAVKFTGDPRVLGQQMSKMSPEEAALFREGYADSKANRVLNMADNRDVTKRLYNSPNDRARMAAVFGDDALKPIENRLRLERIMDMARTALGNSTTTRQLIEAGLAGGGIGGYLGGWHGMLEGAGAGMLGAKAGAINLARTGAQRMIGYVDQRTAAQVAQFLTSDDPKLLQRGIELASKNSRITAGLKAIENKLMTLGGAQVPQRLTPLLPGPLSAGAQDNDQRQRGGRLEAEKDEGEADKPQRAHGGRVDAANIDHNPTEAQKKAGNYAKDHVHIHGLDITIENAKGAERSGVGRDGKPWAVKMPAHYGYIKGTVGKDKDHVDVYVGPHPKSPQAFVVDQMDADSRRFDEHKAFLGFASRVQTRKAYLAAFSDGRGHERLGHMEEMPVAVFKRWLETGETTKRAEGAADAHKLPHKAVGYVARSRVPGKHCAACSMFREGHCSLVRDPIVPGGWCRRFDRRKG